MANLKDYYTSNGWDLKYKDPISNHCHDTKEIRNKTALEKCLKHMVNNIEMEEQKLGLINKYKALLNKGDMHTIYNNYMEYDIPSFADLHQELMNEYTQICELLYNHEACMRKIMCAQCELFCGQ